MSGFILKTSNHSIIRFRYYEAEAPVTYAAFDALLPFSRTFFHARVSGQEIWRNGVQEITFEKLD